MRIATLTAALVATAFSGGASAAEVEVLIDKNRYEPASITVKAGDTVVWRNAETRTSHDVAFDDDVQSERLMPEDQYRRTFATPGRYRYHCVPHPHMKGEVVVEP
ncbi:MAG TPA: cupredoxin domain-containing protein [Azospirillum sp.]|nr:cupredoxin domain-containing protein [Azospirillum sp.]